MNHIFSDRQLETLFDRRSVGTALFLPVELGWLCPEDENHLTTWSEFESHIWCLDCELDYFTLLCPKRYIPGHPYQSQSVVEEEIESVKELMAEWTLERYRDRGGEICPEEDYECSTSDCDHVEVWTWVKPGNSGYICKHHSLPSEEREIKTKKIPCWCPLPKRRVR